MQLIDMITSKIGKTFTVIAMVAMLGGCAGITDAGLEQDNATDQAEEVRVDANEDQTDVEPFSNDDEPGVIYDEPVLDP